MCANKLLYEWEIEIGSGALSLAIHLSMSINEINIVSTKNFKKYTTSWISRKKDRKAIKATIAHLLTHPSAKWKSSFCCFVKFIVIKSDHHWIKRSKSLNGLSLSPYKHFINKKIISTLKFYFAYPSMACISQKKNGNIIEPTKKKIKNEIRTFSATENLV